MSPRKKSAPGWQAVPHAQTVMDKAVPLAVAARETREYAPLAETVLEAVLLFPNADGLPDLRRSGHAAKGWMSDLLDTAGLKAPPMSSKEVRDQVAKDRQSLAQSVREAFSPVRVNYISSLDDLPDELSKRFPGLKSAAEVFDYYKIIPKAQSAIRTANYQRRAALQSIGAAVVGEDGEIPSSRSAEVVRSVHRTVSALSPAAFAELDAETRDQLRQELSETRAALLALENALT
ncbi:hypothetical protein OHV13_28620 [Kitasatospora purpeofusca]|uniref:hypothetical protein n=1 Tax=Kitasatospora purpeofusca TaxID=67352 RepID=UPI00325596E4